MPQRRVDPSEFADVATPVTGGRRSVDPSELADEGGGISPWLIAGGGALAAGAAALAARNPALLKTAGKGFLDLRRMSMLSGMAPLKSLLGNVGSSAYSSIERGSMAPLREMLSPTTAREALAEFKAG